jgi:hypothetical protein
MTKPQNLVLLFNQEATVYGCASESVPRAKDAAGREFLDTADWRTWPWGEGEPQYPGALCTGVGLVAEDGGQLLFCHRDSSLLWKVAADAVAVYPADQFDGAPGDADFRLKAGATQVDRTALRGAVTRDDGAFTRERVLAEVQA